MATLFRDPSTGGVIRLPEYDHAFHLCGQMTVITAGHEYDHQLDDLLKLAKAKCR